MKVFIVFAHPEQESLNGSLHKVAVQELKNQGHEVKVSDLYAMKWKSQIDRDDFPHWPADKPLRVPYASGHAWQSDTLTADVKGEQEKLLWADAIIFHYPLWWYGMPAIMKGWIDRVYSLRFGYGLGEHNEKHWGDRYGEGKLLGKRGMLIVTAGSWPEHFSERGILGPIDSLLYPVNHGALYYVGMDVLPSFVMYHSDQAHEEAFEKASTKLRERMRNLFTTKPIAYRAQNGGDYEIPTLTLKPGLEGSATGLDIHIRPKKNGAVPE